MPTELWVSPVGPRPFRAARRGTFEVRPDGSVAGPSGAGGYSFEDTVEALGWDVQMGGCRMPEYSYELAVESGLGKRHGLRLKKLLSPKAHLKVLSPKGQIKALKSSGHAITHPKETFKKHWRTLEQVHRTITPKPLRRLTSKKNFIKFAPYLAAIAQVLNFIVPGLGVAVGVAITAAAKMLQMQQAKKDLRMIKKMEKEADVKAVVAYDQSQGYFEEKYAINREQFVAMPPEQKMAFLQQVAEDAKEEQTPTGQVKATISTAGTAGWSLSAAGLLALMFL